MLKSIRNILVCILIIILFFMMKTLGSILLPLIVAIMGVVLYQPVIEFLNKKAVPTRLILPGVAVFSLTMITVVFNIFINTGTQIFEKRVYLGQMLFRKIEKIVYYLDEVLPIDIDTSFLSDFQQSFFSSQIFTYAAGGLASGISKFGSSFMMFALYFLFLLFNMHQYNRYISYVGGSDLQFTRNLERIQETIVSYMSIKFVFSISTGIIVGIITSLFGLEFAIFWGFVTFLFNFIPSIGSILATSFPMLMAIVQFDSGVKILILGIILFAIQFTIGNIIEPKIMGNRLRLNTVTVLFGLVFWGYIWGIAGMFLSVPLMVMTKIFLESNESLAFLGRVMGYPE